MNDHRSTTRRRGHYRRRTRQQRTGLAATQAPAKGLAAELTAAEAAVMERAAVEAAAAIARDGGYPESLVLNPESLISRDDHGIRRGPYERSYVISRGYEG